MNMIPVESTDIESIGYENGVLYISFHRGGVYCCCNVPETVFSGLLRAGSKGKYFHAMVSYQWVQQLL